MTATGNVGDRNANISNKFHYIIRPATVAVPYNSRVRLYEWYSL